MDEARLNELFAEGRHQDVATLILRELGPELLGFVRSRLRDATIADDAYAEFCIDLWRGMSGFKRHCSFKAWAYTLARNAALRVGKRQHAPRRREVGLSQLSAFPALEELVRTTRPRYAQTETKDAFVKLREQLSEEEQTLLVLRVDKGLDWQDVAAVLKGELPASQATRECARLRQQFRALKSKLAFMAREAGLLDTDQN